jgi:hypothetical protein
MHTRVCVVCAEKQIMHTTSFTSFTSFTTPSVCILLVAGIHTRIGVVYATKTDSCRTKSKRTQSARGLTCISSARCFTAALLLLYCCFTAEIEKDTKRT